MSNFNEVILFGNISLSDIFKQIHKNNKDTNKQIEGLIEAITPFATSGAGAVSLIMPTVKDLIDVSVKNNEQLIKIAGIAQRGSSSNQTSINDFINPDEIQQLLQEQKNIKLEGERLLNNIPQIENV